MHKQMSFSFTGYVTCTGFNSAKGGRFLSVCPGLFLLGLGTGTIYPKVGQN